ncbi:unnamed protein product [Owenia fusiformis]|uniref:Uncharacterized protein n=1 Tax=Owenia fusiformis TaxID=6347 RepID=A0A8J1TFU0_OWEFU|nr:unnamed protein product [Owenia fusiformis]
MRRKYDMAGRSCKHFNIENPARRYRVDDSDKNPLNEHDNNADAGHGEETAQVYFRNPIFGDHVDNPDETTSSIPYSHFGQRSPRLPPIDVASNKDKPDTSVKYGGIHIGTQNLKSIPLHLPSPTPPVYKDAESTTTQLNVEDNPNDFVQGPLENNHFMLYTHAQQRNPLSILPPIGGARPKTNLHVQIVSEDDHTEHEKPGHDTTQDNPAEYNNNYLSVIEDEAGAKTDRSSSSYLEKDTEISSDGRELVYFADKYDRRFIRLSQLLGRGCFSLFIVHVVVIFTKPALWQVLHGIWGGVIHFLTGFLAKKAFQRHKNQVRTRKMMYHATFVMECISIAVCFAVMGISAYGMYLDRVLHVYNKPCNDPYILRYEFTCEAFRDIETNHTTYHAYLGGYNYKQGLNMGLLIISVLQVSLAGFATAAGYKHLFGKNRLIDTPGATPR